jgi:hypothetical protein
MGIRGCGSIFYTSPKVDLSQLFEIIKQKRNSTTPATSTGGRQPSVDIDAIEVGFKFIETALGPAGSVFGIARAISEAGIYVCIICDGPKQHHSKRASVER